jgi:hypothetical protein
MAPRWDGDNRGHGVGNAAQLLPGAGELTAAFSHPAWVAEQPEIHLRPHVEAWCRRDRRLALTDAYTDDRNAYVLGSRAARRIAARARGTVSCLLPHRMLRRERDLRSPASRRHRGRWLGLTIAVRGRHWRVGPRHPVRTARPRRDHQRDGPVLRPASRRCLAHDRAGWPGDRSYISSSNASATRELEGAWPTPASFGGPII